MSDAEGLNQAQSGVEGGGEQQVDTTKVEATQAAPVGEQPAAGGAVQSDAGIRVGNQSFKTQAELAKAYEDLQRGFTQSSQKYSEQLKAYQAYDEWMKSLGQEGRKALAEFVSQRKQGQQAAPAAPQAPATQPQQAADTSAVERQLMELQAQVEADRFMRTHQHLSVEQFNRVCDVVERYEKRGVTIPLEDAYKLVYFEEAQAQAQRQGQQKAEEAIKQSRNATAVTPNAASAGAAQEKAVKWNPRMTLAEQAEAMKKIANEFGIEQKW